jgi:hypothetical protein
MPGIPGFDPLDPTGGLNRQQKLSVGFVAANGQTYSCNIPGMGGAVDIAIGENFAVAEAIGELSNMGVYIVREGKESWLSIPNAEAVDEMHASPSTVLAMQFENNNGEKVTVDIPAPEATLFAADGFTLRDRTDATVGTLIGAAIDAIETVLNTSYLPNNSYAYVRGVLRSRKFASPKAPGAKPTVLEGSGDTAGPGV